MGVSRRGKQSESESRLVLWCEVRGNRQTDRHDIIMNACMLIFTKSIGLNKVPGIFLKRTHFDFPLQQPEGPTYRYLYREL